MTKKLFILVILLLGRTKEVSLMRLCFLTLICSLILINTSFASDPGLRTHPEFEKQKASISSIAILPALVYYWVKTPLDQAVKPSTPRSDPQLEPVVRRNVESACREIFKDSKYPVSDFTPSESLLVADSQLTIALKGSLSRVESVVIEVQKTKKGPTLSFNMGPDCAYLGRYTTASHLLFVWGTGWEKSKEDENVPFDETKPKFDDFFERQALYLALFLVDASSGEIIWYNESACPGGNIYFPQMGWRKGTKPKDVKKEVEIILKPLLKDKK